jgi:hypothetical protein
VFRHVKLGVIAGPVRTESPASIGPQLPNDVAIGIEHTDLWNIAGRVPLLPPSLAEQIFGKEDGRCGEILGAQQGRLAGHRVGYDFGNVI